MYFNSLEYTIMHSLYVSWPKPNFLLNISTLIDSSIIEKNHHTQPEGSKYINDHGGPDTPDSRSGSLFLIRSHYSHHMDWYQEGEIF